MPHRRLLTQTLRFVSPILLGSLACYGGTWTPDPSLPNPDQHLRLYEIGRRYAEVNFDPAANLVGAQSHHPPNKKQHSTRESASYAYGLLLTGDPADRDRAQKILLRVLATQDTQSNGPTRGAFGWYAEDKPTDLNSSAFDGLTLADVIDLDRRHPSLDADLRQKIENAGRLAVEEVMRRDVDPGYTNIAMLCSALAAAGQKLWAVPGAGDFAQRKLDAVMKLADDGEFYEYRSPTYTGVDVYGAYMARKFAFSDAYAATADATINHFWQQIAASYHAPTFQLGGPYCRAYGDNMLDYVAGLKYPLYLALDGAYPLPDTETDHDWDKAGTMLICDLPISPRAEFKSPPSPWRVVEAVAPTGGFNRQLSQYRQGNFILGTVAYQDEYRQKRNLVADWRNDDSGPLGMRVGFCIDESNETAPGGFPGEKVHWYCQQVKSAALVAMVASTNIPGHPASACLVFDHAAQVIDAKDSRPIKIQDGSITTYLYAVSNKAAAYASATDAHTVRVTRPWASADPVGNLEVLSYLVVFEPSHQSPPVVSDLKLSSNGDEGSAIAKVDGADLAVTFKN